MCVVLGYGEGKCCNCLSMGECPTPVSARAACRHENHVLFFTIFLHFPPSRVYYAQHDDRNIVHIRYLVSRIVQKVVAKIRVRLLLQRYSFAMLRWGHEEY